MISSKTDLTNALTAHLSNAGVGVVPKVSAPARTAIFAVHGISPIQRYAFQDQVALALQSYLCAQERLSGSALTWEAVIHWPHVGTGDDSAAVRPSALRIYRSDEKDPENPTGSIYDVYEGYWSPLSKGKTSVYSALRWLVNALFLGSSSTANIPSKKDNLKSDLGYVPMLPGGARAWMMLMHTCHRALSTVVNPHANPLSHTMTAFISPAQFTGG